MIVWSISCYHKPRWNFIKLTKATACQQQLSSPTHHPKRRGRKRRRARTKTSGQSPGSLRARGPSLWTWRRYATASPPHFPVSFRSHRPSPPRRARARGYPRCCCPRCWCCPPATTLPVRRNSPRVCFPRPSTYFAKSCGGRWGLAAATGGDSGLPPSIQLGLRLCGLPAVPPLVPTAAARGAGVPPVVSLASSSGRGGAPVLLARLSGPGSSQPLLLQLPLLLSPFSSLAIHPGPVVMVSVLRPTRPVLASAADVECGDGPGDQAWPLSSTPCCCRRRRCRRYRFRWSGLPRRQALYVSVKYGGQSFPRLEHVHCTVKKARTYQRSGGGRLQQI